MISKFQVLILYSLLVGCVTMEDIPDLRPPTVSPLAQAAIESATTCENPITPPVWGDPQEWKYGCFCGKGHPAIPEEGKTEEQLIADYYKTKPKDDVDRACQAHDVCWIEHDDGDGECNLDFKKRLAFLAQDFNYRFFDFRNCDRLALAMFSAFSTIFVEENFKDPTLDNTFGVATAITTPPAIIGGWFFNNIWLSIWGGYPSKDQKCLLESD